MFRILDCLTTQHDWRLVAVAGVVCFLASLTAITLFHRARSTKGRARTVWLAAAGAATGCGIWATHFLAMLAYQPGMPVAYDINLTIVSLLAAGVITAIGLAVAVFTPRRWGAPIGGGIIGGGVAAMRREQGPNGRGRAAGAKGWRAPTGGPKPIPRVRSAKAPQP